MTCLARLTAAAALSVALLPAQLSLDLGQPLTSPNQGGVGGGIYFDLTVHSTLTWHAIEYVASDASPGGLSSFDMYVKAGTHVGHTETAAPWVLVASSVPVPINGGFDTAVLGLLQPAGGNTGTVTFAPGDYAIALAAVGHSWGYQNGAQVFANALMTVSTGAATNTFVSVPTFAPRTINGRVWYSPGGSPMSLASTTSYGDGCYALYQSYYEYFENPAASMGAGFDLAGRAVLMTFNRTTNRYEISCSTMAMVPAVGSSIVFPSDDSTRSFTLPVPFERAGKSGRVTTTTIEVATNGYIWLEPHIGGTPTPDRANVDDFLAKEARVGCWHDMRPVSGAGEVYFGYDPAVAHPTLSAMPAYVTTWDGVQITGSSNTNTFQILIFENGDIEMRWASPNLNVGGVNPALVGFTPGHDALDPRETDLWNPAMACVGIETDPIDAVPLGLVSGDRPLIGTSMDLTTVDESSPGIGLLLVGFRDIVPPLDLGLVGAPGCYAHTDPGALVASYVINNFVPTAMTASLPIPPLPGLIGGRLYAQSAWLDPSQNALGMLTSNGLELLIGAF